MYTSAYRSRSHVRRFDSSIEQFGPSPTFQTKGSDPEAGEYDWNNGHAGSVENWNNGNLFVAKKNKDGQFKHIRIVDYGNFVSEDRKKRFPTFRFASNFKRAVAADFIPKGFQQAFYDSMSRGIGRIGTESDKGKIGGISDWVKEKAQTVIGIFPDKDVKIGTARTFYDVGEKGYGKAFNKDGRIKIDKSDEGWNKRMENGGLVPEGSTDSEIDKENGDLTPTEAVAKARADMLSDAALFDGLKASPGFTNLVVTRQSTWEKGSSIDGKKLLLHEIMTHLSIPQRNRKQNYFPKDEDFSSSEQHNEIDMTRKENEFSIDSRIPMNVYK